MDPGRLISAARSSARLSVRALAAEADVAGSTITRIQSGALDPTMGTLARILWAAGYELRVEAVRAGATTGPRLVELVDAWIRRDGQLHIEWVRWRALLDRLVRHPELLPEAIYTTGSPSGEPVVDALLASVAEKLADDAGLPRPSWAASVPPLAEPFRPPRARPTVNGEVPSQLAARGVLVDAGSLWRDRATVGA